MISVVVMVVFHFTLMIAIAIVIVIVVIVLVVVDWSVVMFRSSNMMVVTCQDNVRSRAHLCAPECCALNIQTLVQIFNKHLCQCLFIHIIIIVIIIIIIIIIIDKIVFMIIINF